MEAVAGRLDALDAAAHSRGVRAHLLAERDGHGVLQVRAAHLQHILELDGLLLELVGEAAERREEAHRFLVQADLDARRERVVRRLRHVCVIVRRDDVIAAFRLADHLERAVRKDFVHIHVDRRARAALDRVDGELVEEFAREDLVSGGDERVADLLRQAARLHVRERGGFFHGCDRLDEVGVDGLSRDVEVVDGAHRLHTVVDIIRHVELSNEIVFLAHDTAPSLSAAIWPAVTISDSPASIKIFRFKKWSAL